VIEVQARNSQFQSGSKREKNKKPEKHKHEYLVCFITNMYNMYMSTVAYQHYLQMKSLSEEEDKSWSSRLLLFFFIRYFV